MTHETTTTAEEAPSRRGKSLFAVAAAALVATGSLTGYVVWQRWQEAGEVCARAVDTRADARAVFTDFVDILLGLADDPTSPKIATIRIGFAARLDDRLPELTCNDQHQPVPKEQP